MSMVIATNAANTCARPPMTTRTSPRDQQQPPPPPPSTPTGSPAMDGYYAMFGAEIDNVGKDTNDAIGSSSYFPANVLYGFCYWYSTKMDEFPVLTKSLTGGCSSIVGDIVAQCIENNTALRTEPSGGIHFRRTLAMFCTGLCYGPMLHYIYEFYEHILPINIDEPINQCVEQCAPPTPDRGDDGVPMENALSDEEGLDVESVMDQVVDVHATAYFCHSTMFHSYYTISHRRYVNAFLHVVIDQGLMAFAFVAIMMFVTGIVEGHWQTIDEEFASDYIENIHRLWIAALLAIGPIQMMAFRFLNLKWRALAVSMLDVFEVAMMSYITHRNREVPL